MTLILIFQLFKQAGPVKTELLKEYDLLVDREGLRRLLSKAEKAGDQGAKKILHGVIRLVFTKEELTNSCGKGLRKNKQLRAIRKLPLDSEHCTVCEG